MSLVILELFIMAAIHAAACMAAFQALVTKRDPRSALGWAAVLIFLPFLGLVLYLIFGISRAQSRAEKIMRRHAALERGYTLLNQSVSPDLLPSQQIDSMARLGRKLTSVQLCGGNSITPLHNGNQAYPAMLEAIGQAKKYVLLSTYIFNYGQVAQKFIAALTEAKNRGVDVRVIVDGFGTLYSWHKPWKILSKAGIKTTRFMPLQLFPPHFNINLRCHRKVLVCDGIGFTGGMNISDDDLCPPENIKEHCIHDVQFRCVGPIVTELRQSFLLNWSFCTSEYLTLPDVESPATGCSSCRVVVDGPGNDADVLNDLISGAINLARDSVRIMTPYFLPSHELMAALRSAAQRGVDTRVVLPGKNNLPYMNWATERLLPDLLSAGVRVWYQPPPFAHTKLLAIDDFYCQIGSANLDARSMRLNFELNMEVFDRAFNATLSDFIDRTINDGSEISLRELKSQPWAIRLRNSAAWVFSPYL